MNSLDTNINNYSIEDLLKILNIQSGDKFLIEDSINKFECINAILLCFN